MMVYMTNPEERPKQYDFSGALRTQRAILDAEFFWFGRIRPGSCDLPEVLGATALDTTTDTSESRHIRMEIREDGEWIVDFDAP